MSPTVRLHFFYIVGILAAIIVGLVTVEFGDNAKLVGYVAFALTLSSILLALIAIIYAFVSNSSLAQHIGGLYQASTDVRDSANTLERLTTSLEREVEHVSAKVTATHELVRGLSNPENLPVDQESEEKKPRREVIDGFVDRSSGSGKNALYAAAVAFKEKKPFVRADLFPVLGSGIEDYYWGWLMALDAARIIDIQITYGEGGEATWTVDSYSPNLLEQIEAAAEEAPEASDYPISWSKEKIKGIHDYFAQDGAA